MGAILRYLLGASLIAALAAAGPGAAGAAPALTTIYDLNGAERGPCACAPCQWPRPPPRQSAPPVIKLNKA
jgi:hypothetical protein